MKFALNHAGENRDELEKVLQHYSQNVTDSLKYKSAVFLIENMPFYSSYDGTEIFDSAFETDLPFAVRRKVKDSIFFSFSANMKLLKEGNNYEDLISEELDVNIISATQLIRHIEHSFKAWECISLYQDISFSDFCEYVLPYRSGNEPLQLDSRRANFEQFKWLIDSAKSEQCLVKNIRQLIHDHYFRRYMGLSSEYPWVISYSQLKNFGFYKNCGDAVRYFINVLRSVGIPASQDYVEQWSSHHFRGHSWLSVLVNGKWYTFDVTDGRGLKLLYKNESMPKAYRRGFSFNLDFLKSTKLYYNNDLDVTHEYRDTEMVKVKIKNPAPKSLKKAGVYIYNRYQNWRQIGHCSIHKDTAILENYGNRCFYLIAYEKNGTFYPLTEAVHLNSNNQIRVLSNTQNEVVDTVTLTRKYPLYSPRARRKIDTWMTCLNGNIIKIEGDNKNSSLLFKITTNNTLNKQNIEVDDQNCYTSVSFIRKNNAVHLAELSVIGKKNQIVPGTLTVYSREGELMPKRSFSKINDGNPLTYSTLSGYAKTAVFEFEKPTQLSRIEYQPRNDGNNIEPGNEYELLIWDAKWVSLGRKFAVDTMLTYYNLPANGLYLLRNLNTGSEEYPFVLDRAGTQIWPGMND